MNETNISKTEKQINKEIEKIDNKIIKLKIDRDKSDRITGLTLGLSSYMALANIIDIKSIDPSQLLIRNIIIFTGTLLYIKHKKIGNNKNKELTRMIGIKERLYKIKNKCYNLSVHK